MWKSSYQIVYRLHAVLPDFVIQKSRTPATSKMEFFGTMVNDVH